MREQITNHVASDQESDVGTLHFALRAALARVRTSIPVVVKSVTTDGGVSPVGRVSVQPLIGSLDGNGIVWAHGIIENVPYIRIQGGANAVIIDPEVGDIGMASVCDRDITATKESAQPSPPGSLRRFDFSDMIYVGTTISSQTPTQYVQFNASGITIQSPNAVNVNATGSGNVTVNAAGNASVIAKGTAIVQASAIKLQNAGTALLNLLNSAFASWAETHVHSNGNAGADTGTPTTTPGSSTQTSVVTAE